MKISAAKGATTVPLMPTLVAPPAPPPLPPVAMTRQIVGGQLIISTSDGLTFNAPLNATPEQVCGGAPRCSPR